MSPFSGSLEAMVATICQSIFPICSIDLWNNRGIVASLTLGGNTPSICNQKDESRIALNIWLLYGMAAKGEIFRFGCGSFLCHAIGLSLLCPVQLSPVPLVSNILPPWMILQMHVVHFLLLLLGAPLSNLCHNQPDILWWHTEIRFHGLDDG